LREALIELALTHLSAGVRVTELSVRSLATEIGVSKGAPYRHFPSADALIAAVAARGFSKLVGKLRGAQSTALPAIGIAYVRFAAENPELYRGMYHLPADQIGAYPDLAAEAERAFSVLRRAVGESPDSPPGPASTAAWAYVHGLAELHINRLSTHIDVNDDTTMALLMSAFNQPDG
jgi:AcrR family transcriptional regulator